MHLREVQETVKELKKKLDEKHGAWGPFALVTDLVEEVGEIAEAVKAREGAKPGKELSEEKLGMELADAIYSIAALANHYNIGLEENFEKIISSIRKRFL